MTRRRPRRLLLKVFLLSVVILAVVITFWVVRLDAIVTRQFQGRHWDVPARVYAEPLDLYTGAPMGADDLERELRRLKYRPGDPSVGPGVYRRRGNIFDLHARRVRFLDEQRDPERLLIRASPEAITALKRADGSDVPVFRLDPLLIGSISPVHGEDRLVLTPGEVPQLVRSTVMLIEDRRFEDHHGIDWLGILRASWANLRAGHVVQGGSTLTQQLVKNYFLSDEQTFARKATEAVMAMRLEAHVSKQEILIAYLNEVYLGQDGARAIHGFGLASEYYFAKPLDELDVGEIALLVGMVKGPSFYDPRKHADRARTRRNLVIQEMADAHLIDAAAAQRAAAAPLSLRPPGGRYVPAFLDLVRRDLKRDYAEADLAAAGLAVFTTLDPRAQAAAERALTTQLRRLDASSRARDPRPDAAARPAGAPQPEAPPRLEGAVVISEPNSGDVIAVVGGRDLGSEGFDRALDARRPIGSLVKPAIYLAALETGRYNAATLLDDSPVELTLADGSLWAPQNFTHQVYGQVPMVEALAESMNLATVHLGLDIGLPAVADTLQSLGLDRRPVLNPSLLLGTVEMTPLEVVQVYTSLANGGFRARLRAVHAVLDERGRPLKSFKVQVEAAAPPAAVYQLDRMLTVVNSHGTGKGAAARLPPGTITAGKTGTSSDTRDSWFAGFTGSHLAVVWVGYDDNRVTGLTGAAGALPVWADAMASLKSASFRPVMPDGVEDRWISLTDGRGTRPECGADAVLIALPVGTPLLPDVGCGGAASPAGSPAHPTPASPSEGVGDKIKEWLKHLIH